MIETNDFRYMWRGKIQKVLPKEDAYRLEPIFIQKKTHRRALLLLHGFSSTPAVYRLIIPKLLNYDAILCPVLPGHGENLQAFSKVKATDWLKGAESAYESLQENYTQVDVMGLSLGGLLACHLAQKYPINHLYLLNPALALKLNQHAALILARALKWLGISQIPNRAGNLHTKQHFELTYRKLPLFPIIEILSLIKNAPLPTFTCPTDLFLGVFDKVVAVKTVAKIFENLPHVHLHWLKNSAHVLPIDGDVDEIIRLVNRK